MLTSVEGVFTWLRISSCDSKSERTTIKKNVIYSNIQRQIEYNPNRFSLLMHEPNNVLFSVYTLDLSSRYFTSYQYSITSTEWNKKGK